jgi:DNA-binding transcriptional LysR family regulator
VLAPVLSEWLATRPGVGISLTESTSADRLSRGLAAGELDVTIGPRGETGVGSVTVLGEEEILLAMAAEHPLARRRSGPTFADLAGEPIVHYARENGLRDWLDARAASAGVVLTATVETRQAMAAARLAAAGLGLALVPATALSLPFPGRLRQLRPRLRRDVVMSRVDTQDALLTSLCDALVARGLPAPEL